MYTSFEPPWEVTYLSDDVGVRVLSLDGGGMRGIMELEVLRAIEKSLGGNIRIQSFFDLIVGTSTGGINALALGVKQWSVGYCIEMFEKFCDQAFTEREFRGVWGLEQAALLNHGSKYKATPLHNVLKGTLGKSPLFGANDSLNAFKTKVAVTATSADGKEAMIFANYSRPQSSGDSQTFIRPGNPSNELEVWEAAAATSAAPFYFKPYTHTKTGTSYIDGGLYHNNPVHVANRERKLLWPAIANKHPDMLLSIGTGQNLSEQRTEASERRASSPKDDTTPTAQTIKSGGIRRTFNALYQRFDNILDAEHTWTEFEADVNNLNDGFPSPYIRLNLDLKSKLPPFDAKDKFQEFRTEVRRRLKDPDAMRMVKDVACSLVASSFYFKLSKTAPLRGGSFMCTGYICCRFEEGSASLKALGEFLSNQCTPNFMPEFVIQDTSKCTDGRGVKVKLTEKLISRLTTYGMLRIPHIDFEVPNAMASTTIALVLQGGCQDGTQKYLLSGFPRTLVQEVPCRPSNSTHDSRSSTISTHRDRHYYQHKVASMERHQMHSRPTENSATPSRLTQARPPLPPRPKSSSQPYPYATNSRMDSAVELPHYTRIPQAPQQYSTQEEYARPESAPVYQAFSYERTATTHLVERAARKVQFEDERKVHKSRGGEKRLVKKRGSGKVSVEAR
ncbi:FabD/lysophospholipase-like protein, partial [Aureobasidium melanogenum]